jgi:dimethylargininase
LFTKAIVRPPGSNFAAGLTTVDLGRPDYLVALAQHSSYCDVLVSCGLELLRLEVDESFPDGTFVEDTAVVTERLAVITNPGAASRRGEVVAISQALGSFYPTLRNLSAPATLDGGDICEAGTHFFIGISDRTNEAGAAALASILAVSGYSSTFVDIRGVPGILHLKSGIAYLSGGHLLVIDSLCRREEFRRYELLRVPFGEDYAANCIEINDQVLIAAGFPQTERLINKLGYQTIALEMSEFQKMDGGLSCLSLRF